MFLSAMSLCYVIAYLRLVFVKIIVPGPSCVKFYPSTFGIESAFNCVCVRWCVSAVVSACDRNTRLRVLFSVFELLSVRAGVYSSWCLFELVPVP